MKGDGSFGLTSRPSASPFPAPHELLWQDAIGSGSRTVGSHLLMLLGVPIRLATLLYLRPSRAARKQKRVRHTPKVPRGQRSACSCETARSAWRLAGWLAGWMAAGCLLACLPACLSCVACTVTIAVQVVPPQRCDVKQAMPYAASPTVQRSSGRRPSTHAVHADVSWHAFARIRPRRFVVSQSRTRIGTTPRQDIPTGAGRRWLFQRKYEHTESTHTRARTSQSS